MIFEIWAVNEIDLMTIPGVYKTVVPNQIDKHGRRYDSVKYFIEIDTVDQIVNLSKKLEYPIAITAESDSTNSLMIWNGNPY